MMPIKFQSRASDEFEIVVDWYEGQRVGLGGKFADSFTIAIEALRRQPMGFAKFYNKHRRIHVGSFPFAIFYQVTEDLIIVTAVIDMRRSPRMIRRRLPDGEGPTS